jgi:hypothetical protein
VSRGFWEQGGGKRFTAEDAEGTEIRAGWVGGAGRSGPSAVGAASGQREATAFQGNGCATGSGTRFKLTLNPHPFQRPERDAAPKIVSWRQRCSTRQQRGRLFWEKGPVPIDGRALTMNSPHGLRLVGWMPLGTFQLIFPYYFVPAGNVPGTSGLLPAGYLTRTVALPYGHQNRQKQGVLACVKRS